MNKYNNLIDLMKNTTIGPVISGIENVYVLLKDFDEFKEENFINCIDEYVEELKYEIGQSWESFFNDEELLKDMLVYYMNMDPAKWIDLLFHHTDYSTSEINEFIQTHTDYFELDINEWKVYSSSL